MKEKYIKVNGHEYYVRDSQHGSSCVILLHGWPDDSSLWKFQIPAIVSSGYRVICFDWLGHGQSEKSKDLKNYTTTALSADVIELMNVLSLTKAHCVAHDYGAVVGWELATKYPERLISYVALSVGHPLALVKNTSLESILKSWFLIFNSLPGAIFIYRAINGAFFKWMMRNHPDKKNVVNNFLGDRDAFYIKAWECANPILPFLFSFLIKGESPYGIVNVPTFGIWSSNDQFMAEAQMKKSNDFVEAEWQYERVSHCHHWLQLEKPEEINKHILEWLNKYQM
jgi:epoxide hydrolase 4